MAVLLSKKYDMNQVLENNGKENVPQRFMKISLKIFFPVIILKMIFFRRLLFVEGNLKISFYNRRFKNTG